MGKAFKILSIDGGGIKGLYSATILEHLEKVSGNASADCFHLICGTSTGAIIALALSKGKTAADIGKFYVDDGPKLFPYGRLRYWTIGLARQILFGGKYSQHRFVSSLDTLFGESKLGDAKTLLCIPTYDLTKGEPTVFKKDHGALTRDSNLKMADVAYASAAAPTFFPIANLLDSQYVDGGVWANNPALCGFLEAMDYFVGEDKEFDAIEMLSISALDFPRGWHLKHGSRKSVFGWRQRLFEVPLRGQSFFTDFYLKKMAAKWQPLLHYHRINAEGLVSADQTKFVRLDFASPTAIQLIKKFGNEKGMLVSKDPAILSFFKTIR